MADRSRSPDRGSVLFLFPAAFVIVLVLGAIAIVVWTVLLVLGIAFFSEMDRQGVWDDLDDGTYGSSVVLDAASGPVTTG